MVNNQKESVELISLIYNEVLTKPKTNKPTQYPTPVQYGAIGIIYTYRNR